MTAAYCYDCPLRFPLYSLANEHNVATGHDWTWEPELAYGSAFRAAVDARRVAPPGAETP